MGQVCCKKGLINQTSNHASTEQGSNNGSSGSLNHEDTSLFKIAHANMSNDESVYHNRKHLEDVVKFVKEAINEVSKSVPAIASHEWRVALVTAACMHDICHPAGGDKANIHQIAQHVTGKLPELNATLEHMHGQIGVAMLQQTKSFSKVPQQQKTIQVYRITELIMSTNLETYNIPFEPQLSIMDVAKTIIRCGDLCHFTFELPRHLRRVKALNKELGITMDNVNFIQRYVVPQFELLSKVSGTPRSKEWLSNILFKLHYWRDLA